MRKPLTLYWVPRACSVVPQALLLHLGIPHETIRMKWGPDGLDAADGSFSHAEYLDISPSGYVPALMTPEGVSITEMPAIMTYIVSLAPTSPKMLGIEGIERAKVFEWLTWMSGTLHGLGFGMIFAPKRFTNDEASYAAVRAKGKEAVRACYRRIEDRLQGRTTAVDSGTTVVDFYLYIFFHWGFGIEFDMIEDFPCYTEVVRQVENLKGVKEAADAHLLQSCFK